MDPIVSREIKSRSFTIEIPYMIQTISILDYILYNIASRYSFYFTVNKHSI